MFGEDEHEIMDICQIHMNTFAYIDSHCHFHPFIGAKHKRILNGRYPRGMVKVGKTLSVCAVNRDSFFCQYDYNNHKSILHKSNLFDEGDVPNTLQYLNGQNVMVGHESGTIDLIDLRARPLTVIKANTDSNSSINSIAFNPNEPKAAFVSNEIGQVFKYNLRKNAMEKIADFTSEGINCMAFDEYTSKYVIGTETGTIYQIDSHLKKQDIKCNISDHSISYITPYNDNLSFITTSDNNIVVADLAEMKVIGRIVDDEKKNNKDVLPYTKVLYFKRKDRIIAINNTKEQFWIQDATKKIKEYDDLRSMKAKKQKFSEEDRKQVIKSFFGDL